MPGESPNGDPSTASREMEYLANERTFLAWIRTSIAVISLGFVVARFSLWLKEMGLELQRQPGSHTQGVSLPMGETMVIMGSLLPLLAAWRYHVVNQAIEEGHIRANRWLVGSIAAILSLVGIAMAVYLILKAGS